MVRLDKWLSENENVSRNQAVTLIESGNCIVNGVIIASKKHMVGESDEVVLTIPEPEPVDILPEDIPLDILYEDADLLVVNKPRGMVTHPSHGHSSGTLVNALMFHCGENLSGINGKVRLGIVHRLDKDTSGLLIVAKNDSAHNAIAAQLQARTVLREYEAVVCGNVKNADEFVEIYAPIGRSISYRKKMCVTDKNSREAVTQYKVVMNYGRYTHLRIRLITGRTHQIRVHMAYRGYPVAGDSLYGNGKPASLNGQCLHAKKVGFTLPKSGEWLEVESELPGYFEEFIKWNI